MKILSFVLGFILLTSTCQAVERTVQTNCDETFSETNGLTLVRYPLENYELSDFIERVRDLSESPSLSMEVKDTLRELATRNISVGQANVLHFFKGNGHTIDKVEKLVKALDVPQSIIALELLVVKSDQNYFSPSESTSGILATANDSIIFKGESYQTLLDLKKALAVDHDVEMITTSLTTCKEYAQHSAYTETLRMVPKEVITENQVMFVDKNVYEAQFSASLKPSIISGNQVTIRCCLENKFPELDSSKLFLSSYFIPRKVATDLSIPNGSFGILTGAIDTASSAHLGMTVIGDVVQNQADQKFITLIVKPVIIEMREHPKLDHLFD